MNAWMPRSCAKISGQESNVASKERNGHDLLCNHIAMGKRVGSFICTDLPVHSGKVHPRELHLRPCTFYQLHPGTSTTVPPLKDAAKST